MKATDILIEEHQIIKNVLQCLDRIAEEAAKEGEAPKEGETPIEAAKTEGSEKTEEK